jgi:hypothetical protein
LGSELGFASICFVADASLFSTSFIGGSDGLCPSLEFRQALGVVDCAGGAVPEALVSVSLENGQPRQNDER